jgi:ABC-type Fe3+ transport system permease subunit
MPQGTERVNAREVVVTGVSGAAILFPLDILFNLVQQQSVAWHVLYAGATYVLAVLVALVFPWYMVWKAHHLARLALGTALFTLFQLGVVLGSATIMPAVFKSLHHPNDRWSMVWAGFVVWGAFQLLLLESIRRRLPRLLDRS